MYLLQLAATQQQRFDNVCAAVTTQATQGPTTQGPATTDDNDTVSDACLDALVTLETNLASCTPTPQNPTIVCEGVCRGYYDDFIDNCPALVSLLTIVTSCINQLVTAYYVAAHIILYYNIVVI